MSVGIGEGVGEGVDVASGAGISVAATVGADVPIPTLGIERVGMFVDGRSSEQPAATATAAKIDVILNMTRSAPRFT